MAAILINPDDKTVTEVEFDGSLDQAYDLTGCNMITTMGLPNGNVMLLDEDGMLKPTQKPFKIMGHVFVGKTLLVSSRSWKLPPKLTLAEAQSLIQFPKG